MKSYGLRVVLLGVLIFTISCILPLTALASSGHVSGKLVAITPGISHQVGAVPEGTKFALPTEAILKPSKATWSCFTTTFAGKVNSSTMWGQGYINCSENVATIDMTEYALYCQPVVYTCFWFNQGQIGRGCTYHNLNAQWCPSSGTVRRSGIGSGQLWAVQTSVCAYAYDGSSDCGATQQDVQF
jgi:hypothetical protein